MHNIYTTDSFILKGINLGEANRYFYVFTKDFGLIKATAQGIRHLKSKLRYNLEVFSYVQLSLVRGREIWRITNAGEKVSFFILDQKGEEKSSEKNLLISRIFSLLLRLLHGEEKNDELFLTLKEGMFFLKNSVLSKNELENFECIMALRILASLGYLEKVGEFGPFVSTQIFTSDLLVSMSAVRSRAIWEINRSLRETHL